MTSSLSTITFESPSNQAASPPRKSSLPWFPSIFLANIRSLRYKMDEMQAVVDVNLPGIVCLVETWLNPSICDSLISLSGYCSYRCDRSDGWGGVCVYVNSQIPCKKILSYESSEIESLWLEIRPLRLPRAISFILLGVVYHPPNNGATENLALLDLIRNNVDSFLSQHPDGLTVVCGDFNPTSTGITEQQTKNSTGLSQLIKILTRDTGTLEWCLSNRPKLFAPPLQLPKLGTSDHFTVMIKPKTIRTKSNSSCERYI